MVEPVFQEVYSVHCSYMILSLFSHLRLRLFFGLCSDPQFRSMVIQVLYSCLKVLDSLICQPITHALFIDHADPSSQNKCEYYFKSCIVIESIKSVSRSHCPVFEVHCV